LQQRAGREFGRSRAALPLAFSNTPQTNRQSDVEPILRLLRDQQYLFFSKNDAAVRVVLASCGLSMPGEADVRLKGRELFAMGTKYYFQ
jgi:hypothetical protein